MLCLVQLSVAVEVVGLENLAHQATHLQKVQLAVRVLRHQLLDAAHALRHPLRRHLFRSVFDAVALFVGLLMDEVGNLRSVDNLGALLILLIKPLVKVLVHELVLTPKELLHDLVDVLESFNLVKCVDIPCVEFQPVLVDQLFQLSTLGVA